METNEKKRTVSLSTLRVGESATIEKLDTPPAVRLRLCDLGMNVGARVSCIGEGPLGDPRAYLARGRVIAVRAKDAKYVKCKI